MTEWPTVDELRDAVTDALESVAHRNRGEQAGSPPWTRQVFVEIKNRLPQYLECQALQRKDIAQQHGFLHKEYIYDFTANIYHKDDDHFLLQTAVAGESEWRHGEQVFFWDFRKLLQSDALLCFYIFEPPYSNIENCFQKLSQAVIRKQAIRRAHGLSTSAYLLSCRWNYPGSREFKHRFVDCDGGQFAYDRSAGWLERRGGAAAGA